MDNILNDFVFVIVTKFLSEILFTIALSKYAFLWRWVTPSLHLRCVDSWDRLIMHRSMQIRCSATFGLILGDSETACSNIGGSTPARQPVEVPS